MSFSSLSISFQGVGAEVAVLLAIRLIICSIGPAGVDGAAEPNAEANSGSAEPPEATASATRSAIRSWASLL